MLHDVFMGLLTAYAAEHFRDLVRDKRLLVGLQATLEGILASGTTCLNRVARAAPLTAAAPHAERRLRRLVRGENKRGRLDADAIGARLIELGARRLAGQDEVLVALDGSALRKPHAKDLEHLSTVLALGGGLVPGYPTLNAVGLCEDGTRALLYHRTYSPLEPGWKSENAEVRRAVHAIVAALRRHGVGRVVFVLDRGFDDEALLRLISGLGCCFVVRAKRLDRSVRPEPGERPRALDALLAAAPVLARLALRRPVTDDGGRVRWRPGPAELRGRAVFWLKDDRPLYAVRVEFGGGSREGWLLLTNLPVEGERDAARVPWRYLQRWSVEEVFAWTKGALGWEDARLLDFGALRTLVALAWVAASFALDLGASLEEPELRLLAHLGGWVPHKGRTPGKKVLLRGLAVLASALLVRGLQRQPQLMHTQLALQTRLLG